MSSTECLYKFRSFESELHRKVISNREVWFAHPSAFNDPFDCNIPIRVEDMPEECLVEMMVEVTLNRRSDLSLQEAEKEVRRALEKQEVRESDWDELRDYQRTLMNRQAGVLSLTRHWNGPGSHLMWSHYANNYTGFVVGFELDVLRQWLWETSGAPRTEKGKQKGLQIRELPVCYGEEMPDLVPCVQGDSQIIHDLVSHKSDDFAFERETRLLMMRFSEKSDEPELQGLGERDRRQHLPDEAFREVIVGASVRDSDRKWVKEHLQSFDSNVRLYQTTIDREVREYVLHTDQIDY